MYRLPKMPENSEIDEDTPLHEASLTDSDLYATCASGCSDASQSDTENIVQAIFSAWLQFPPRRSQDPEGQDCELLGPEARNAMSLVWRQITAEGVSLPEPEVIIHGVAESMVEHLYPRQLEVPEGEEELIKGAYRDHVTEVVAESWRQILQEIEEENAQKRRKHLRRKRVREILAFYRLFAVMDDSPPLDCRVFCIFLCQCCSIFPLQFPIHTALLCWPLSIGIMGVIYVKQCPMSRFMPYVMMALGMSGTLALLMRLSFAFYEKFSGERIRKRWLWTLLKVIEFAVLDCLVIQLYYYFSKTPSFESSSPEYCNETFYTFVRWINYLSIALVCAWAFVYTVKGLLWLFGRNKRRVTSDC